MLRILVVVCWGPCGPAAGAMCVQSEGRDSGIVRHLLRTSLPASCRTCAKGSAAATQLQQTWVVDTCAAVLDVICGPFGGRYEVRYCDFV